MNNMDFFSNPLSTVHLLSVFSHINVLSDFLYSQKLLHEKDQFKPIPIVNSLYEYFKLNNDELGKKTSLVRELLQGSDLYGANLYETIDSDYVDSMFNYIIGDIAFRKYGNIYGFLSETIIWTDDVTLSSFENRIKNHLKNSNHTNEDGSSSQLSVLAANKIFEDFILPLFPRTENNRKITSPDYIYAQSGLAFARAAKMDPRKLTFEELVEISQTMELSVHQTQMDDAVLSIFALAAMLYYCHTEKNSLRRERISNFVQNPENWVFAYEHLFKYLDSIFEKPQNILKETRQKSPMNQFKVAIALYKTRSQLAEENIRIHCPLENEASIKNYKNILGQFHCQTRGITLPDVTRIFNEQNRRIANKYFNMEKALIGGSFGGLNIQLLNIANVTIFEIRAMGEKSENRKQSSSQVNYKSDIFEIYISSTGYSTYNALIRENDKLNLLMDEDEDYLLERVGLKNGLEFRRTSNILKQENESFEIFSTRIAGRRANFLERALDAEDHNGKNWRESMRSISNRVPYQTCVNDSISDGTTKTAIDCTLDGATLISVHGALINIAAGTIPESLLKKLGISNRALAFREAMPLVLRMIGRSNSPNTHKEFQRVFTRKLFESISSSLLQSSDPGLEFFKRLTPFGIRRTTRLLSLIGRQFSLSLYNKISEPLKKLEDSVKSIKLGKFQGHDVHVDTLSGIGGYGPKFIPTYLGKFQLRKILGSQEEEPVKLIKIESSRNIYKKVIIETGETFGLELDLQNDIYQPKFTQPLVSLKNILKPGTSVRAANRKARKFCEGVRIEHDEQNSNSSKKNDLDKPLRVLESKIEEPILFWELRCEESLVPNGVNSYDISSKIQAIYGSDKMQEIADNINEAVDIFNYDAHDDLLFEDFYAILNYAGSGFSRIHEESDEARRMQNAFYRLAVRQADYAENSSKLLYRGEARDSIVANSFNESSVIEIHGFTSTSMGGSTAFLRMQFDLLRRGASCVPILYEIRIDSTFLTSDIHNIIPNKEVDAVLIPGTEFRIDKVEDVTLWGMKFRKLSISNIHVDKSKWLVDMMRRIRSLKDSGTRFYFDAP